jgi:hypothetical protein
MYWEITMKLLEIFIKETTEEDRAIVSLSSAISKYIQKYETIDDDGDSWKDHDYDDQLDFSEISSDAPIKLGTIGSLFNTPLTGLNNVKLELQSDYAIRHRLKKSTGEKIKKPDEGVIFGLWYPSSDTLVLNKDFIGSNKLKTVISHELRHALDDYKSDYKANKEKGRYSRPKKKHHRKKYHDGPNYPYLAQPAEINARFIEALHLVTNSLTRASKSPNIDLIEYGIKELKKYLKDRHIEELFPEKEKSKDYKRLIKRAIDYIYKEAEYLKSKKD